nr:hypothetical protein [Streptomyces sp. MK7]
MRPSKAWACVAASGRLEGQAAELTGVLLPWRQTYPDIEVVEQPRSGSAAELLIKASREASLLIVGRRVRQTPLCPTSDTSPTPSCTTPPLPARSSRTAEY